MNLKDALLCIDCDEVFTVEGTACNPRCPVCASSVSALLSTWVRSWTAVERSERKTGRAARDNGSVKRPRMKIMRSTPIAA